MARYLVTFLLVMDGLVYRAWAAVAGDVYGVSTLDAGEPLLEAMLHSVDDAVAAAQAMDAAVMEPSADLGHPILQTGSPSRSVGRSWGMKKRPLHAVVGVYA